MRVLKGFLTISIILFCSEIRGQTIENIQAKVKDNLIIVEFDLSDTVNDRLYKPELRFYTQNGQKIVPDAVSGDTGFTDAGNNKRIMWDMSKQYDHFFKQVTPEIAITKSRVFRGPGNALWSVLVPGLGAHRVSGSYDNGLNYRTAIVYGAIGYGIFQKLRSNNLLDKKEKFYKKYLEASDQPEIDDYYEKANSANKEAQKAEDRAKIAIYGGAALWAADVLWVAVKGFQNKEELKTIKGNKQVHVNYDQRSGAYLVGYSYSF